MDDVLIIGGGYAGMAAALQLLRARRRVRVVDAGLRRNRFAAHSHGFLTQDGADPAQIAATARAQLGRYATLTWVQGQAVALTGDKGAFAVTLADGTQARAARVILATGLRDILPPIPGLARRWGRSVFHCPYCHGYELDGGAIGVIAAGPEILHHVALFADWGAVTLLTDAKVTPDPALALPVRIEPTPVAAIEGEARVRLADGRALDFAGLFVATRTEPATRLDGPDLEETPLGTQYRTDGFKETSVPGVYACGDVARAPHSLSLAVGDGAWAGAMVHRSLVFDA